MLRIIALNPDSREHHSAQPLDKRAPRFRRIAARAPPQGERRARLAKSTTVSGAIAHSIRQQCRRTRQIQFAPIRAHVTDKQFTSRKRAGRHRSCSCSEIDGQKAAIPIGFSCSGGHSGGLLGAGVNPAVRRRVRAPVPPCHCRAAPAASAEPPPIQTSRGPKGSLQHYRFAFRNCTLSRPWRGAKSRRRASIPTQLFARR